MSKMLGSPRALATLTIVTAVFVLSILGGALGEAFGLGFLSSSLPVISLTRLTQLKATQLSCVIWSVITVNISLQT